MSIGIIFQHFWVEQKHESELLAYKNALDLIEKLPNSVPVLSFDNTKIEIDQRIKQKFNISQIKNIDITQTESCKLFLKEWIHKNNLTTIYIAGLHFEYCVMAVCDFLKQICYEEKFSWENNFKVRVIKECTAFVQKDSFWFISTEEVIKHTGL